MNIKTNPIKASSIQGRKDQFIRNVVKYKYKEKITGRK